MQGSIAAQDAAKVAMSQATQGVIPTSQINVVRIVLLASRRLSRDPDNRGDLYEVSGIPTRRGLGTVYTQVTFLLLAKLEEIVKIEDKWLNNTATLTYMLWLKRTVITSVRENTFVENLKSAGSSAGVNVFNFAKISILPTFSEPLTVYVATYAPTGLPSGEPTSVPTWGKSISL